MVPPRSRGLTPHQPWIDGATTAEHLPAHLSTTLPVTLAPSCPGCPGGTASEVLAGWVAEMAGFLKCLDPNHLVSVGTSGYFGETDSDE